MGISFSHLVGTANQALEKKRVRGIEEQERASEQEMELLRRALMQAQIDKLGRPEPETPVNWQTLETRDGKFVQVNPRTGENRGLGLQAPIKTTSQGGPRLAGQLRRQFNQEITIGEANRIASAYGKVKAAASQPSAAGDLSLIFAYMRILDPTSVVREGEFANAQNAAGVPDMVRNLYNRAISGERLNERQRADFVNQAGNIARQQRDLIQPHIDRYTKLAEGYGIGSDEVIYDPFEASGLTAAVPQLGAPSTPGAAPTPGGVPQLPQNPFRKRQP